MAAAPASGCTNCEAICRKPEVIQQITSSTIALGIAETSRVAAERRYQMPL
ncbi:MAG: hypothetical protein ACLUOF_02975 [Ruminococcus sp.]